MFSRKKNTTENNSNKEQQKASSVKAGNLKNPEILEVNLVRDEIVIHFDWNKHLFTAILAVIFAGALIFQVYLGLDYWEQAERERAMEIEQEAMILRSEVATLTNKSKDALSFKDKSSAFSDLLDNHIYWTRFFTWLESNTLNTVTYNGFYGNLSGSYTLSASAPSFAEASWQVKVLSENQFVKNVMVDSVTSGQDSSNQNDEAVQENVSFEIVLDINPAIFKKN